MSKSATPSCWTVRRAEELRLLPTLDVLIIVLAILGNAALVVVGDDWITFSEEAAGKLAIASCGWWKARFERQAT